MIPVVSHATRSIFFYSAKAGCTSLRQLYLEVHRDELSEELKSKLNWYHNLNELCPYDPSVDHSDYFTYIITRNPYGRIVSAFLDQYVYSRNESVQAMLDNYCAGSQPDNFLEFLLFLKDVPNEQRDTHFQTQAYFQYAPMIVTPASPRYRWLKQKPPHAFGINYAGDISQFSRHMSAIFKRVFKRNRSKLKSALASIEAIKKANSSFYCSETYENAALLNASELDDMVFAPKPQDFLINPVVVELIDDIYSDDFKSFGYLKGKIPHKSASAEIELLPKDFDWKMYLRLNPDLTPDKVYNKRGVVRHYLEFGRFEEHPRAYKIEAPEGFDWQVYLSLNTDLVMSGIDSKEAAIEHYLSYGIREYRATR